MADTTIDLSGGRLTAKNLVRRCVPTTVRISLAIYDQKNRRYVQVPGMKGTIPIKTRGELLKMWKAIRESVESQDWSANADTGDRGVAADGAHGSDSRQ